MRRGGLGLAQHAIKPARSRCDRLGLNRAEIVSRAFDPNEVDPRIVRGDALEDGEWTELVRFALDDEGRTCGRAERRLVSRARALRRCDRMAEDHEGVWWLYLGQECRDAAAKRAPDERDPLVPLGAECVTCFA